MPKKELNEDFVKSVTTQKTQERFQDKKVDGLVLKVTQTSKNYYLIKTITIPGQGKRQIEKRIGKVGAISLSAARERAKKVLAEYITQNSDPLFAYTTQKTDRRKLPTLEEVYQKWLIRYAKQKNTSRYENLKNGYSVLARHYGRVDEKGKKITLARGLAELKINEIDEKKISIWQRDLLEAVGLKPSSINRVCLELKRLIDFAVSEGLVDDAFRPPNIQKLSEREIDPRKDFFDKIEIEKLLKGIDRYVEEEKHGKYDMGYIRDIMLFMLYTGFRPSSVCGLEWRDIDFQNNVITLRAANIKTKRTETNKPSIHARAILEKRFASGLSIAPTDKVFTNYSSDMVCRKIKKILKYIFGSGTKHSAYTFRHTFATYLSQTTDLAVVMRAMNHRRIDTTMKYIAVDGQRVQEAVDSLNFEENATNNRDKQEE